MYILPITLLLMLYQVHPHFAISSDITAIRYVLLLTTYWNLYKAESKKLSAFHRLHLTKFGWMTLQWRHQSSMVYVAENFLHSYSVNYTCEKLTLAATTQTNITVVVTLSSHSSGAQLLQLRKHGRKRSYDHISRFDCMYLQPGLSLYRPYL